MKKKRFEPNSQVFIITSMQKEIIVFEKAKLVKLYIVKKI